MLSKANQGLKMWWMRKGEIKISQNKSVTWLNGKTYGCQWSVLAKTS
jgi:hypothetical protein